VKTCVQNIATELRYFMSTSQQQLMKNFNRFCTAFDNETIISTVTLLTNSTDYNTLCLIPRCAKL